MFGTGIRRRLPRNGFELRPDRCKSPAIVSRSPPQAPGRDMEPAQCRPLALIHILFMLHLSHEVPSAGRSFVSSSSICSLDDVTAVSLFLSPIFHLIHFHFVTSRTSLFLLHLIARFLNSTVFYIWVTSRRGTLSNSYLPNN